jgi:putative ABC transport system ATP-binding protein
MAGEAVVTIDGLNHFFGEGTLRKQILYDISTSIRAGEIVIVTGPSGSGKTTLLTLVGALRSAQDGSLRVLGRELRDATQTTLVDVRRQVGFIFQAHNLLGALSASQNVQMALHGSPRLTRVGARARAAEMLRAVGLADRVDHYPHQLSGGQKQRVAIARALALEPHIVLADEPTASLDKVSGREVVDLLFQLARKQDCAVLLVTHDNRILDIADRIVHLEDGRLSGFADAVLANTQQLLTTLAQENRRGELARRLQELPDEQFVTLLAQVTAEVQRFRDTVLALNTEAFESMLEQLLKACTLKIGQLLEADRATLFLIDEERGELWSKVAQHEGEHLLEIRLPIGQGIAGHVARTGTVLNVPDAYAEPLFHQEVDRETGYRTRSILCAPMCDARGRTFAVAQLLNKRSGAPFGADDERRFREFATAVGVIVETWRDMRERGAARVGAA